MPWSRTSAVSQRLQLLALLESEAITKSEAARRFGVSRKTVYKWLDRYKREGPGALEDRDPVAERIRHKLPAEVVARVLAIRKEHPTWGPKKIRSCLSEHCFWRVPAASSIGALLNQYGLVTAARRRKRTPPSVLPLHPTTAPNETWCVDFKGHFTLKNGARCYPLTLSDHQTRYLLRCEAMDKTGEEYVRPHFERAFQEFGVPERIRSDNGPPFATKALGGLSQLSIWWIKLGIAPERIEPGKPQQNGRHERMHRTLAQEIRPQKDFAEQQLALDRFRHVFNELRPHEALGQKPPGKFYRPSNRKMPLRPSDPEYPREMEVRRLDADGRLRFRGSPNTLLTRVLAGEAVGLEQLEENLWRVYFGPVPLAHVEAHKRELRISRVDDRAPLQSRSRA